jgi:hypothetical protein
LENLIATNLLPKISNNNPQNPNLEQERQKQQAKYHEGLLKFTAYCIYRIRSSIAHHKIGEYLMTHQDEAFMINFAEPLIDEVISHCFKTDVNT